MDACVISAPEPGITLAHRIKGRRRRSAGFSLVEVILAVGVIAFSFVGLYGLLLIGLDTFRQAMASSVSAQIHQSILNDAQQTDFSVLTSGSATPDLYFDEQGRKMSGPAGAIYHVRTKVTGTTSMPGGATLTALATITVQIATNPGNKTIASDAVTGMWLDPSVPIVSYSGYVARND